MFEPGDADFRDIEGQRANFFACWRGELLTLGGDSPKRDVCHSGADGSTADEACLFEAKQTVVDGAAMFDAHDLAQKGLSRIDGRAEKRQHVGGFAPALLVSDRSRKNGHGGLSKVLAGWIVSSLHR